MKKIDESVYMAPGCQITGDVVIGKNSSVWYNAVLRADSNHIWIGENTNIQDCAVLHEDEDYPLEIGDNVTVGHGAIVHGCKIGNNVLIGMGAILLDGAVVGENCIIGAGALVTQGKVIPAGSMLYGNPAKIVREVTVEEIGGITESSKHYCEKAANARRQ